ncbi:MAG: hypothetical protein R3B09_04360 [Nannocystaceae bacterium]
MFLAAVLAAARLHAAAAPSPLVDVDLVWRAPPGCPDAAAITDMVAAMLPRPPVRGPDAPRVRALVSRARGRWALRLDLRSRRGHARRLAFADECQVLARAAALLIAIHHDPLAAAIGLEVSPPPPGPGGPPPASPPTVGDGGSAAAASASDLSSGTSGGAGSRPVGGPRSGDLSSGTSDSAARDLSSGTSGSVKGDLSSGTANSAARDPSSGTANSAARDPSSRTSDSAARDPSSRTSDSAAGGGAARSGTSDSAAPGADLPGADLPGADLPGADLPEEGADASLMEADPPSDPLAGADPSPFAAPLDPPVEDLAVEREPDPAPPPAPPGLLGHVRADGGLDVGVLPGVGGHVGLFGGLSRGRVRAELGLVGVPLRVAPGAAGARFDRLAGAARVCPIGSRSTLTFALCVGVEAGALHAVARDVARPSPLWVPWVGLTLSPALRWRLRGPLGLYFAVDGVLALTRPRFTVHGGDPVFRAGRAGARATIGVELQFGRRNR